MTERLRKALKKLRRELAIVAARLDHAAISQYYSTKHGVCGFLDSDGLDYCGHPPGHSAGHYTYDPMGVIPTSRHCLVCRQLTTAHLCVCDSCRPSPANPGIWE